MNCAILPLFFHMWCIQNLKRTKGITEFSIHTILPTVNSKSIILLLIHFCIHCLLKHLWYFTDLQLLNCWVLCFPIYSFTVSSPIPLLSVSSPIHCWILCYIHCTDTISLFTTEYFHTSTALLLNIYLTTHTLNS